MRSSGLFARRAALLGLLVIMFGTALLLLAPAPAAHAVTRSNNIVAQSESVVYSTSGAPINLLQIKPTDLLVLATMCETGTFTVTVNSVYSWSGSATSTNVADNASQAWSPALTTQITSTGQVLQVFSARSTHTGLVQIVDTLNTAATKCDLWAGEFDTDSQYFGAVNFLTQITQCTLAENNMPSPDCQTTPDLTLQNTIPPNPPLPFNAGTLEIGFGATDCSGGSGASFSFTAGFPVSNNIQSTCGAVNEFIMGHTYFPSGGGYTPPTTRYIWGTQSDVNANVSQSYLGSNCILNSFVCNVWSRSTANLMLTFLPTGSAVSQFQTNDIVSGCLTPNATASPFELFGGVPYISPIASTSVAGGVLKFETAFFDPTHPIAANVRIKLEVLLSSGSNAIPLGFNNPLQVFGLPQTFDFAQFATPTSVTATFNLGIPANRWWAVALVTNDTAVYLADDVNGKQTYWTSALPSYAETTFFVINPFVVDYTCFGGDLQQPSVSFTTSVTTTNITQQTSTLTTITCASGSTCVTSTASTTATLTTFRTENAPDMSTFNYWFFPLLIVFVPFAFVEGVVALGTDADADALAEIGLITIDLTSWLGYAWNGFVPSFIPVSFSLLTAVYFWRR